MAALLIITIFRFGILVSAVKSNEEQKDNILLPPNYQLWDWMYSLQDN